MNGMVRRTPPQEMRRWKQWVLWGRKDDTKHPPKTPYQATGYPASPTNPLQWSKYDDVMYEYVKSGNYHGIGFVFSENDGLVGIDLDKVIDEQGNLDNKAKEIVERFNTYVEKSPSGRGLHIICKGSIPKGGKKGNVEMYSWGRYFTYTGDVLKDLEVNECQEAIDWLFDKYIKNKDNQPTIEDVAQTIPTVPNLETDILLKKMFDSKKGAEIERLYKGDWEGLGYPSQSEADLALCNHLAFWTNKDKAKMDAMFRESGLMRDSWDEKHGEKTLGERALDKAIADTTDTYKEGAVKEYSWDDIGNSNRFKDKFENVLKFCYENNSWCGFNGIVWELFANDKATAAAMTISKDMGKEAKNMEKDTKDEFMKFIKQTRNNNRINGMLNLARSHLSIKNSDFDNNIHLFNCKNGTLNLYDGSLSPHNSLDFETRYSNVEIKNGIPTLWIKFLNEIFLNNQELILYVQKMLGYCLTGSVKEQKMFLLIGDGNNGKSVFINVISDIFGSYVANIQAETIAVNGNKSGANSDIARLKGARLVICSENNEGIRLNEGLVKQLTGGDRVTARFLFGREFEFNPIFKLILVTNHPPQVRGTDLGIWRRFAIIPFKYQVPNEIMDKNLKHKLMEEAPYILHWILQGYLLWQKEGFHKVAAMEQHLNEYRTNMDTIAQFINACCVVNPEHKIQASILYQAYSTWARTNGEFVQTNTKFGREMARRFEKYTSKTIFYMGLSLKAEFMPYYPTQPP